MDEEEKGLNQFSRTELLVGKEGIDKIKKAKAISKYDMIFN